MKEVISMVIGFVAMAYVLYSLWGSDGKSALPIAEPSVSARQSSLCVAQIRLTKEDK